MKKFDLEVHKYYWVRYKLCEPEIMQICRKRNYIHLEFVAIGGHKFELDSKDICILDEVITSKPTYLVHKFGGEKIEFNELGEAIKYAKPLGFAISEIYSKEVSYE